MQISNLKQMSYRERVLLDINEMRKIGVRTPSQKVLDSEEVRLDIEDYAKNGCSIQDATDLIIQTYMFRK